MVTATTETSEMNIEINKELIKKNNKEEYKTPKTHLAKVTWIFNKTKIKMYIVINATFTKMILGKLKIYLLKNEKVFLSGSY